MLDFQIVLVLLTVVAALGIVARHLRLPRPIVLVLGGLLLGLVPTAPRVQLPPDLVCA